MKEFIQKHQADIVGVLSGFDRVRFRGTIRTLAVTEGLTVWLSHRRVLFKDFKPFAEGLTADLKASVQSIAGGVGQTIEYLPSSSYSKEEHVQDLIHSQGVTEGLVCVLSCVEPCRSFIINRNPQTKHLDLVPAPRKCLHWYCYFLDPQIGLCHVRIQSWLPFTVQVCINGRDWLCRQLQLAGIGFQRRDNCVVSAANLVRAQALLNSQPWAKWSDILNDLLRRSCPALLELPTWDGTLAYYWSADETEWATDVMFRTPEALEKLYPFLIHHGITTFSSRDVLRFLGRTRMPANGRVDLRFQGEVVSDLKYRPEGVRIKHSVNRNSIKMYNKQVYVLRVETTINNPYDMAVYRASEADPSGKKKWSRLRKGVADLPRRAEISQAANNRYLTAMSAVDATTPLGEVADAVSLPVVRDGRRYRGLQPLTNPDAKVAEAMLHGEFAINGFRNRDIRQLLFEATEDKAEIRRQSGKVTRLLRLFREHGLILKVHGTHRYQITAEGRRVLPAFVVARNASTEKLHGLAAKLQSTAA